MQNSWKYTVVKVASILIYFMLNSWLIFCKNILADFCTNHTWINNDIGTEILVLRNKSLHFNYGNKMSTEPIPLIFRHVMVPVLRICYRFMHIWIQPKMWIRIRIQNFSLSCLKRSTTFFSYNCWNVKKWWVGKNRTLW